MEMCQLKKVYRLIKAQISLNLYIRTQILDQSWNI